MARNKVKNIELNIEVDVLTFAHCAEIANEILEFLLFNRNQIEFVYKTYRHLVNKWLEEDETNGDENGHYLMKSQSFSNYKLQRQKELAKQTKNAISSMRQFIHRSFEEYSVKSLRFLLGSSTFSAKECYTIHMPYKAITRRHSHHHHSIRNLNQMLLTLVTHEHLDDIFSNNLCPTNIFLELELLEDSKESKESLVPKSSNSIPNSCKDVHIHLVHKVPQNCMTSMNLQCCQDLRIFGDEEDVHSLELSNSEDYEVEHEELEGSWWQTDFVVHGFKEKQCAKGTSIWNR